MWRAGHSERPPTHNESKRRTAPQGNAGRGEEAQPSSRKYRDRVHCSSHTAVIESSMTFSDERLLLLLLLLLLLQLALDLQHDDERRSDP